MAQGYSGYSILDSNVTIKDSANLDAFSRLRISQATALFATQFTYDLAPILYEQIINGTGASIVHDTTNRMAIMTFSSTPTGGKSYMQTYEYLPYQPGKSQLSFITFNMVAAVANTLKFAGYSDGVNGVEFQLNGTTKQFTIYSASSAGNETVTQSSWNLDKLDGTGASGITLDITKTQILVIDLQALYVGRVRIGFDMGGQVIYAHEFKHANQIVYPYIQSANLPIRCGMTCSGTVSTTMNFICSSVVTEGGLDDINVFGYTFEANTNVSATIGGVPAILLRPKTTFNGITNRARVAYIDVEVLNNGVQPVRWDLCIGQSITGGTWSDVNSTYSGVEVNKGATLSGSPDIVIDAGWVSSSGSAKTTTNTSIIARYPITLNAAGAVRNLGTLALNLTSVSGSQSCYVGIKYREIR